jgi:MFS family permease
MTRTYALYLTSIISGFCMMALEILGGRFLQPFFGSGIDIWAAIISVFILSLSVGYWLGGRIADRSSTNRALGTILVAAGICYLLLPVWARPFLEALGPEVHTARGGVLLAALILFLPPSLLLGCVSPMLVKLVFVSGDQVGRTTGTLYAIGSFGNVVGILVSDYVLLATFDLNHNILAMGIALCGTGITHLLIQVKAQGVETPLASSPAPAVAEAPAAEAAPAATAEPSP